MIVKKMCFMLLIMLNSLALFGSKLQDNEKKPTLNFVMATDKEYVLPTLVAMYSVIKNCPNCIKRFIIFVGGNKILKNYDQQQPIDDDFDRIGWLQSQEDYAVTQAPDQLDEAKLLALGEQEDVQVFIVDVPEELIDRLENLISKDSSRLVCLRVFIPDLFRDGKVFYKKQTEGNAIELKDYLWVDSDVLVVKDISEMYLECKNRNQPIIGANYFYIECSLTDPASRPILFCPTQSVTDLNESNKQTIQKSKKDSETQPREKKSCQGQIHQRRQISGGVVFFNLEMKKLQKQPEDQLLKTSKLAKPPALATFKTKKIELTLPSIFENLLQNNRTEECAMTQYLAAHKHQDIYFLPITYNCRLCYPKAAEILLQNASELKLGEEDKRILTEVKNSEVFIWHPDRETKFWDIQTSETIWHQFANEIQQFFP